MQPKSCVFGRAHLLQGLGGEAPDAVPDGEYDNIYIVSDPRFGPTSTLHLRGP